MVHTTPPRDSAEAEACSFRSAPLRIYRDRHGRFAVTTLGACTWYTISTGQDINAAAAWVKRRGGALGARGEDARGQYREGFINWYQIPERLRPPLG